MLTGQGDQGLCGEVPYNYIGKTRLRRDPVLWAAEEGARGGGVARAADQGLLFLARSSEEKRKGVGGVDVDEAGAVSTKKQTRLALDAGTALCGELLPRFGRATAAKVAPHVPTFGDLARMSKSQIETTCHEIGGNLKIWTAKFDQWRAAVTVKLGMELVAEGDEVHAENNGKEYQADEEGPGMSSSAYESSGVDIDDEEDVALQNANS